MTQPEKQTGRRIPVGMILLAAFIGVPLAEIAVFIEVGGWIGLGWTLALVVLTAVIGTAMLRQQGFAVLSRAKRELEQDRMPIAEVFEGLCLVVAGALLLTPGFITDSVGALLLLPPVRGWLYALVRRRLEAEVVKAARGPGDGPRPPGRGPVIEGEFEEVDRDDDPGTMPPPRGDWGQRR